MFQPAGPACLISIKKIPKRNLADVGMAQLMHWTDKVHVQ